MTKRSKHSSFPTKEEILAFIQESATPVSKQDIARAFRIRGHDRVRLKDILREIKDSSELKWDRRKHIVPPNALPEVAVLEITGVDEDGETLAHPVIKDGLGATSVFIDPEGHGHIALAMGERVLARLSQETDQSYTGKVIRVLGKAEAATQILGLYKVRRDGKGFLSPTDRRHKTDFLVADSNGAEPNELVLAHLQPSSRAGAKSVKVMERLGSMGEARTISLIAIHTHGLPVMFSHAAQEQAAAAKSPVLESRVDLRDIPLVTIDGADARDFDDAVFAEPDPQQPGGWHLVVAIADVAHYVPPGSPLDKAALERGNSTYFPDRVVPMLPEELSNDLCSLKPNVDRACLAVHMWIDQKGILRRHQFVRGLMRSVARLTYDQVQAAYEGRPDAATQSLLQNVIQPLYAAYRVLAAARKDRGTLDLDLPERAVKLAPGGQIVSITRRERYDSHRLIEEFMIAANVAAAEALEARGFSCMYRVHDNPSQEKLMGLRTFLKILGYSLPMAKQLRPENFARILEKVKDRPEAQLINDMILRSQAQAVYSPRNIGHFGLALSRYAHFTSPIRRYADLVVHRALIQAYHLGDGGLGDPGATGLEQTAAHISFTERRSVAAERDAADRYVAAYLVGRVGETFAGRITGVTRFGLFVSLDETGADGLVPIRRLPRDYYHHDEVHHSLRGQRLGHTYRLGATVKVTLVEADPLTGSMVLDLEEVTSADPFEELVQQPVPSSDRRRNSRHRRATTSRSTRRS